MIDLLGLAERFLSIIETAPVELALLAIFVWIFLEEMGIPLAPTADMVLLYAGWQVAEGRLNPVVVVALTVIATVGGSGVLYWLSLRGGHAFVFKFSRVLRVDQAKLDRFERWLNQYRGPSLMIGRFVPGLKTVTSIVAGVFEVPPRSFFVYTAISATVWAISSVTIGRIFGPQVGDLANVVVQNPRFAASLATAVGLIVAVYFIRRLRRTV